MTTENKSNNISLNDIASCVSLIDVVSQRGAIKGSELTTVGVLRDKLSNFLEEAKKSEEEKTQETDNTTDDSN